MALFARVKVEEHLAMQGYEGLLRIYRSGKHMRSLWEGVAEKLRPPWRSRHRLWVITDVSSDEKSLTKMQI